MEIYFIPNKEDNWGAEIKYPKWFINSAPFFELLSHPNLYKIDGYQINILRNNSLQAIGVEFQSAEEATAFIMQWC